MHTTCVRTALRKIQGHSLTIVGFQKQHRYYVLCLHCKCLPQGLSEEVPPLYKAHAPTARFICQSQLVATGFPQLRTLLLDYCRSHHPFLSRNCFWDYAALWDGVGAVGWGWGLAMGAGILSYKASNNIMWRIEEKRRKKKEKRKKGRKWTQWLVPRRHFRHYASVT